MKYIYAVLKTELVDSDKTMFTDVIAVFTSLKQLQQHKFVDTDTIYYEVKKMPVNEIIQDDFIKGIEILFEEGKMGVTLKNGKIKFKPFKKS
jgi:hypothetical protein